MENNALVVHGGGPTAVMNSSLYGVIEEAAENPRVGVVYGAIGGMEGIIKENLMNLSAFDAETLKRLLVTPGSAIGSSRYPVTDEDYKKIPIIMEKYRIRYLLPNGGNGTMDTCGKIYDACVKAGYSSLRVVGIPKTIDNDIAVTDHTPGYGSAAKYVAATTAEIAADVNSLPIHVCIIEALGRNAGWITAASALARKRQGDAPHLIYLPERPFDEEQFLTDVRALHEKLGGVVVVVSEGLKKADKTPIVEPIFKTKRAVYYGDISSYLAELVIKRLGIKARSEKPGLAGRASVPWQSETDREEAVTVGREALKAAVGGSTGVMIGFVRKNTENGSYRIETTKIPIEKVMLLEKTVPDEFINDKGNDVTPAFTGWCRPLVGWLPERFLNFKDYMEGD